MNKLLAVILTTVLFLTSCGLAPKEDASVKNENTPAAESTLAPESSPASADNSEASIVDYRYTDARLNYPGKTIIVWQYDSGFAQISADVERAVNEYLASLGRDYVVCFTSLTTRSAERDYLSQVKQKLSQGLPIDILSTGSSYGASGEYASVPQRYIFDGLYDPLDDYIDSTELGQKLLETYPEKYLDTLRIDGRLYGLAAGERMVSNGSGYAVNKELAEKYGWDINRPISEQLDILKSVADNEPNCAAFLNAGSFGLTMYYPNPFANISGVYYDAESDRVKRLTEDKDFISMLEPLSLAKSNGVYTGDMDYLSGSKKTFFLLYGITAPAGVAFGTETIAIAGENAVSIINAYDGFSIQSAVYQTGICSASEHKDEAFDFLALSQTDPYLNNLLAYGIEGEDYEVADGIAQKAIDIKGVSNSFICYPQITEPADYADMLYDFFENAELPAWMGFCFDASPVADVYVNVKAVLQNRNFASADIDAMLECINKEFDEAEIDELIDEINRQYSEWRENNR